MYSRGYWKDNGLYGTADHRAVRRVLGGAAAAGLIPFDLADTLKAAVNTGGADALYAPITIRRGQSRGGGPRDARTRQPAAPDADGGSVTLVASISSRSDRRSHERRKA